MESKMKQEDDIAKIDKFTNFLLPNKFKRIGFILFIFAFISYFAVGVYVESNNYYLIQNIAHTIAILSLLMIAISKEKVEDELIAKIRMQSYHYAVIGTVIVHFYMFFVPSILTLLFYSAQTIQENNDIFVLVCLLVIKIVTFKKLKKAYYEE